MKFTVGPAMVTSVSSMRGRRRLEMLTGTGRPQPMMKPARAGLESAMNEAISGSTTVPTNSMCAMGLMVTRPSS